MWFMKTILSTHDKKKKKEAKPWAFDSKACFDNSKICGLQTSFATGEIVFETEGHTKLF